ncbi:hypothetical protein HY26_08945 [Hyphomonas sp. GM-8P]|nr:hypothetical protein HY26_08945 [Hyphomonas sp. GM-8P]
MASQARDQYSDDDIERAMATVARVIELYGDAYWPILERLEAELEERRAKAARLTRHLKRFRQRRHIDLTASKKIASAEPGRFSSV